MDLWCWYAIKSEYVGFKESPSGVELRVALGDMQFESWIWRDFFPSLALFCFMLTIGPKVLEAFSVLENNLS